MTKSIINSISIFLGFLTLLFASATGFAVQVPHVYYVTNNFVTKDGGVGIAGAPDNCFPTMGWVPYKTTQEFLCKDEIPKDQYFEFNAAVSNTYFETIDCFKDDFKYLMRGKAVTTLTMCGAFQKKK